jgi:methylated-DNA-[protein]-cysteine S-methyltransferase
MLETGKRNSSSAHEELSVATVYKFVPSPVGTLKLVANAQGLIAVLWENDDPKRVRLADAVHAPDHEFLLTAERELGEYFAGARTEFAVDLDFAGTPFQRKVWKALLEIPFGETRTYMHIATRVGSANGARAVGAAIGKNPVSIIAPCHRVVGSNGSLTGFAGGLDAKRYLLALEGRKGA